MAKKRMPFYDIIGIFRDFLAHNFTKYINIFQSYQVYSAQYLLTYGQKCTKSAIYQFATFNKSQSPIKFQTLHFLIFSLEIFNTAFQLNLAVNYRLQFLNFDFDAISPKFHQKCAKV